MNTQANKPLHLRPPLLIGGAVAILVSGIAIASLALSAQGFNGAVAPDEPRETPAGQVIAAPEPVPGAREYMCAECGVIESTRKIDIPDENSRAGVSGRMAAGNRGQIGAKPLPNYEITIRLHGGSMRVITDAKPARWRHGERVIVIAGAD
jgi:hypothetical protein